MTDFTTRPFFFSAAFLGTLIAIFAVSAAGYHVPLFHVLGIPAISPIFDDARQILLSLDVQASGVDPILAHKYCYGRGWLWIGGLLHLGAKQALLVGSIFVGVYAISVVCLLQKFARTRIVQVWIFALAISPAALLLVERANLDCLLFGLVVVSVLALERMPSAAWLSIFAGFTMKLYPLFALVSFACLSLRRLLIYVAVTLVCAGVFVLYTYQDYATLTHIMPYPSMLAFGRLVPVLLVEPVSPLLAAIVNAGQILLFLAAIYCGFRWSSLLVSDFSNTQLIAFFAGAGVFLISFLATSNYNYRLVYCLLCIPVLVTVGYGTLNGKLGILGRGTLWSLAVTNWYMLLRHPTLHHKLPTFLAPLSPLNDTITALSDIVGVVSSLIAFLLMTTIAAMVLRPLLERQVQAIGLLFPRRSHAACDQ